VELDSPKTEPLGTIGAIFYGPDVIPVTQPQAIASKHSSISLSKFIQCFVRKTMLHKSEIHFSKELI